MEEDIESWNENLGRVYGIAAAMYRSYAELMLSDEIANLRWL